MPPHRVVAWIGKGVLLGSIFLGLGGCFLMSSQPGRPDPTQPVSGPPVAAERCQNCHQAEADGAYAQSRHAAMGIRCGQCHTPGGHPNFTEPVRDGTCAGCHQPAYEQTVTSTHFADRQLRSLDDNRAARATLRREGFTATTPGGRLFVGDSTSGTQGGRLCMACHYDEHRLGLGTVQRALFCDSCHTGFDQHFARGTSAEPNRCTRCHVRAGTTDSGQTINTHQFARPVRQRPSP